MDDLLFLSHRIPMPPDKGDKIRSYHVLKHVAARFQVHLGCFYDDPLDARYVKELERWCATVLCLPLDPYRARLRSARALLKGQSLTQAYFHDPRLARWVADTVRERRPSRIYVFGSAMAPYALPFTRTTRVFDMVDFDSEKWGAYAASRPWPFSWLYARERRCLLELEHKAATEFNYTLLVSHAEADLFRRSLPGIGARVRELRNGVDTGYFDPDLVYANPFPSQVLPIVFSGAMDYWPNVQAAEWFVRSVMPMIAGRNPRMEFWIVGSNPSRSVRRLAAVPGVRVTGRVEDVRPYLAHAAAVVAPLQIARGIQNKVLEAMAMAKPVVATPQAAEGILQSGDALIVCGDSSNFAEGLSRAIGEEGARIGRRARKLVGERYQWRESWAALDALLADPDPRDPREAMRARLSAAVGGA